MKIPIISGNICDTPEGINVIIHQANTMNVMGAGVALALRNKWQQVFDVDTIHYQNAYKKAMELYGDARKATFHVEVNRLGEFSWCNIELNDGRRGWCINLYGQRLRRPSLAGCATDYNAVISGLTKVREDIIKCDGAEKFHVGIPYLMGCGLAGGDWHIYNAIIESVFVKNAPFKVTYVKFNG